MKKALLLVLFWAAPLAFANKSPVIIVEHKCLDNTGAAFVANVKDAISLSPDFEVVNTGAIFYVDIVCVDASTFSAVSTVVLVSDGKERRTNDMAHSIFLVTQSAVRARADEFLNVLRDARVWAAQK